MAYPRPLRRPGRWADNHPMSTTDELLARLRRLEDERDIQQLILSYGPAADAGLTERAAAVWADDGVYDWDADGAPHEGRAAVDRMLQGRQHQTLIAGGAAHFAGPALISVDGDTATALNYSLIMLREEGRHYLWRVSAARWDLARVDGSWRVTCRSNRLLDATGAGRVLFGETIGAEFPLDDG